MKGRKAHVSLVLITVLFFIPIAALSCATAAEPIRINGNRQMLLGGQQVLSIMNYQTGVTHTWCIVQGGGSIEPSVGEHVTYTAPPTNPFCENNPIIRVTDSSGNSGEIGISITYADHSKTAYWEIYTENLHPADGAGSCAWAIRKQRYYCDGTPQWESEPCTSCDCSTPECCCDFTHVGVFPNDYWICAADAFHCTLAELRERCITQDSCGLGTCEDGCVDVRTEDMEATGCCPSALCGEQEDMSPPPDIYLGRDRGDDRPVCDPARVSDPVSVYNGNNNEMEEDLRFSSPGRKPFIFKRSYNSRSNTMGSLGYGWTHTYDLHLEPFYDFEGSVYVKIIDETGRGVFFSHEDGIHYPGAFLERTRVEKEDGNYVWYRRDGERYIFDQPGRLMRIEDITGNVENLAYDDTDHLLSVEDAAGGRHLTFHYDENGRLDHISGPATTAVPDGVWVSYGYDKRHNLTSVTYAEGSGLSYSYADGRDRHNLTEKRNKAGHFLASWKYDDQDRATKNISRDGRGAKIDYADDNTVYVTDAYGITRTYTIWDVSGRDKITDIAGPEGCPACGAAVKRFEYNGAGHVIEMEYASGRIDQYGNFDERGNAGATVYAVLTPEERAVTTVFHPDIDGKLSESRSSIIGEGRKETIWDYDDDGNDVANEQPGHLLKKWIEKGYTRTIDGELIPYEYVTTFTHNAKGQVTGIDGPKPGCGDLTIFEYDDETGNLLSATVPEIGTTTYSEYDAAGRPGCITDPNGNAYLFTYDGRGRVTSVTAGSDGSVTTWSYNTAGEISQVIAPDGTALQYTYDVDYGRLIGVQDSLGNAVRYSYDEQGNITEERRCHPDGERAFRKRFDYHGPTMPGKLWREIDPDETYTEYTYDEGGNIQSIRDPNGKVSMWSYDLFDRITSVTEPGGVVTVYGYDMRGNPITVTDAENRETTYCFDDMDRLVVTTSPDTGTTSYTYDEAGKRIAKKDAKGVMTSYAYDDAGRSTDIHYPDVTRDIHYRYDEGENGAGRLTGSEGPGWSRFYGYDTRGNLIQEEITVEGLTYTTGYAYDEAGHVTAMTYPDGLIVTYEHDGSGRVTKVETDRNGAKKTIAGNVMYLPFGPVSSYSFGNETVVAKTFDELYRVSRVVTGELQDLIYTRDAAGHIMAVTDLLDDERSQRFSYDDLYRLTGASGIYGTITYSYDRVGNRLTETTQESMDNYTYEAGTNRLVSITGGRMNSFTHDETGNMTSIDTVALSYNENNRLIEAADGRGVIGRYLYDAEEKRLMKTTAAGTVIFHYDREGHLIGESSPAGEFITDYIYLGDIRLAAVRKEVPKEIAVRVTTTGGRDLSGVSVYAFTESGSYTGKHAVTDGNGVASFSPMEFSEGLYRFRADYLTSKFWSEDVTIPGTREVVIEIEEETTTVEVTQGDEPKEGITVYVFNENGSYLGLNAVTDVNGRASFILPAGLTVQFRADMLGDRFFSETTTVVSGGTNTVSIATGGGTLTVLLEKAQNEPLTGIKTHLFGRSGSYLGLSGTTDGEGHVLYHVPSGTYTVRADYRGCRFWSGEITVNADASFTMTIPHQDVAVTVVGEYDGAVEPREDLSVYLFTADGSFVGESETTGAEGRVTFNLPQGEFKVRVDCLSQWFWSEVFSWNDEVVTIEEGIAAVCVSQGAFPLENVSISVFSDSGNYLGLSGTTDTDGCLDFRLPAGNYKFRVDHQGGRYWASRTVEADSINEVRIDTGGGTFSLAVNAEAEMPLADVGVHVFSQSGSYLGISGTTDTDGMVSFDLSDGDYTFRVDYLGYQFWSDVCVVPTILSNTLTIPHEYVSITVESIYDRERAPLEHIKIYLFTPGGSYLGAYETTNNEGTVVFHLPEQEFMVRADYLGSRYWSGPFTWSDQVIDIAHGRAMIHVTDDGTDITDASVYLFSDTGGYLGVSGKTDGGGYVSFTLPAKAYRFRVDHNGARYWSEATDIIAHEETEIGLQLEELALHETNDPLPCRFDGTPPAYAPEPVLLACIGTLTGLLSQSVIARIPEEEVYYYYINDHLGTPVTLIDEDNQVVWAADYVPFGEASINVDTIENNFRFPGQYFDDETGLHYNWHRYYKPEIGRYVTADPIGLAGGINLYGYCLSDPVNGVDPEGKFMFAPLVYFGAAKALAIGTAYLGFKFAQHIINSTDPCEDKISDRDINKAFIGVGLINAGEVIAFGSVNAALEAPAVYAAIITNPAVIQNAADFVQGFVPSSFPPPSFGGLLGFESGRLYEMYTDDK